MNQKTQPQTTNVNHSERNLYSQKLMQYASRRNRNITKANVISAVVAAVVLNTEQVTLDEFILT